MYFNSNFNGREIDMLSLGDADSILVHERICSQRRAVRKMERRGKQAV
jgi:hypothetical protein